MSFGNSFKFSRGLRIGTEDDSTATDDIVVDMTEVVPAESAEVEASQAEVETTAGEVGAMADTAAASEADFEVLESFEAQAEGSLENDGPGLQEETAQAMEVAVEAIAARLGVQVKRKIGKEGFKNRTRREGTVKALEGIKETISEGLKNLKQLILNTWERIKAFFARLFIDLDKQKALAAKLKGIVEKLDSEDPKVAEMESKTSAAAFASNSVGDVLALHVLFADGFNAAAGKIVKAADDLGKVDDPANAVAEADQIVKTLGGEIASVLKLSKEPGYVYNGTIKVSEKGDLSFEKGKAPESAKIKALSKKEMLEVISDTEKVLDAAEKAKNAKNEVERATKSLLKTVDKIINRKDEVGQKLRGSVTALNASCMGVATRVPGITLMATKAALGYVQDSIKQFNAKAADSAKTEDGKAGDGKDGKK